MTCAALRQIGGTPSEKTAGDRGSVDAISRRRHINRRRFNGRVCGPETGFKP